jgi:hypothetical protein
MSEKTRYLNLSDGGHIENLGVYELLRRRCKFVVAVDGEADPQRSFGGLQKQAAEELGITETHERRLLRELKRGGDKNSGKGTRKMSEREVYVGITDAACMHLHQHLIEAGLRLRNVVDLPCHELFAAGTTAAFIIVFS